jgi:methylenetetrahydrofolate reductase (NADPH)
MTNLERKLTERAFVVTAEMPVIDGGGHAEIQRQLEPMRPFVDAFNATDNPAAHAHCSPLAVSIGLRQAGDEPEARRVFDLDSIQLIALARSLDRGTYLSGREIHPQPHFFVGAVENPSAPPLEYRVRRAAKKALAGARYLQLQLCYRPELLEHFMYAAHDIALTERIALIPSICILRTVGSMRFVANHVPGIDVPPSVVSRVEQAADPEAECFEIAYELAAHALAQPGVAGLHFISFRKDAGIAKLCGRLGIPPRIERESHGYSAPVAV